MSDSTFLIEGINPEPWTAPNLGTGRKGGKTYVQAYKNPGLAAYQEAVKEDLQYNYPDWPIWLNQPISLHLFFWRQLPVYSSERGAVRKHQADATNLQKALEDALQGVLFANDRDVVEVSSTIMEQDFETEPAIMIFMAEPEIPDTFNKLREEILRTRENNKPDDGGESCGRHPSDGLF